MKKGIVLIILSLFVAEGALACGPVYPTDVYEPYRISRNMSYLFLDNPRDYSSYLFGDKLNPVTFYIAYKQWQGQPLSQEQIDQLFIMFDNNGNYYGINKVTDKWGYTDYVYTASTSEELYPVWKKLRDEVMIDNFYYPNINEYNPLSRCSSGMFEQAIKNIKTNKGKWADNDLRNWIKNQDEVIKACFDSYDKNYNYHPTFKVNCGPADTLSTNQNKTGFWAKVINFFLNLFKPQINNEIKSLASTSTLFSFVGSDEFLQNQTYQKGQCNLYGGNLKEAQSIFSGISKSKNNKFYIDARLAYVRAASRNDQSNKTELLKTINDAISDGSLSEYRDVFKLEKEKLLANYFDATEFNKSWEVLDKKDLADLAHNMSIFTEQYGFLEKKERLVNLDSYPEFAQFLYYWNVASVDQDIISKIENKYKVSSQKDLWLALLLKKAGQINDYRISDDWLQKGLPADEKNLFQFVLSYYANRLLIKTGKIAAMKNINSMIESGDISDIEYNYFTDLAMTNSDNLDDAIKYLGRKLSFVIDTYTYYYDAQRVKGDAVNHECNYYGEDVTGDDHANCSEGNPLDDRLLEFINFGLPIDKLYANKIIRDRFGKKIMTRAYLLGRKDIYLPLAKQYAKDDKNLADALKVKDDITGNFLFAYTFLKEFHVSGKDLYGISIRNNNMNFYANDNDWGVAANFTTRPDDWYDAEKTELIWWKNDELTKDYNQKYLTQKEIDQNIKEKEFLFNGSIFKTFAEAILNYAKVNPKDSRVPEALAKLNEFRRVHMYHEYEYNDGDWPQKVFNYLHKYYPKSKWAIDTKYYY